VADMVHGSLLRPTRLSRAEAQACGGEGRDLLRSLPGSELPEFEKYWADCVLSSNVWRSDRIAAGSLTYARLPARTLTS
jgi:hypothetical protein